MKKILALAILALLLMGLIRQRLHLSDDLVQSLDASDPQRAALFKAFHANGFFDKKIFVDVTASALNDEQAMKVETLLAAHGYHATSLWRPPSAEVFASLVPMLPLSVIQEHVSPSFVVQRSKEAAAMAALPGAGAFFEHLPLDPLNFTPAVIKLFRENMQGSTGKPAARSWDTRVYERSGPLVYEDVGVLYDALRARYPQLRMIGGDFFAVENYRAVKADIHFCMLASVPLSLLLFLVFFRRWLFFALFLAGSALSYVTGLGLVSVFYSEIYAIVIAFTSTFIGFNNDYMVHLSGLDRRQFPNMRIGLTSAIGTTLIGFLILLFAQSVVVRQVGLVAIGGMLGFLSFLFLFRQRLATLSLRTFRWPLLRLPPIVLPLGLVLVAAGLAVVGLPRVGTHIDGFGFKSPFLQAQEEHFTAQANAISLGSFYAVSLKGRDPLVVWQALRSQWPGSLSPHPLDIYREEAQQQANLAILKEQGNEALTSLQAALVGQGIRMSITKNPWQQQAPMSPVAFLHAMAGLSPLVWLLGDDTLVFATRHDLPAAAVSQWGLFPLSPKTHYNSLLTEVSQQMGRLLLMALLVMAVYLRCVHRNAFEVLYVLAPLLMAALGLSLYLNWRGESLSVIHIMGIALVVSLITDYTGMAVANEHAVLALNRVLLTGLSTLVSFGVLCFAKSPVLVELGRTVIIGVALAWPYALLISFQRRQEPVAAGEVV